MHFFAVTRRFQAFLRRHLISKCVMPRRAKRRQTRLALEPLEDRCLLSSFALASPLDWNVGDEGKELSARQLSHPSAIGQGRSRRSLPVGTGWILGRFRRPRRRRGRGIKRRLRSRQARHEQYGLLASGRSLAAGAPVAAPSATTTTLTATPVLSSSAGLSYVLTASVHSSGATPPTGNVEFIGNGILGTATLNNQGLATLTVSAQDADLGTLTAVYLGDAKNAASAGGVTGMRPSPGLRPRKPALRPSRPRPLARHRWPSRPCPIQPIPASSLTKPRPTASPSN